jgi:hypothetical protein
MRKKIQAQLINELTNEVISEHFYDIAGETLESILQKVEKYVIYENINHNYPIRIKVNYSEKGAQNG